MAPKRSKLDATARKCVVCDSTIYRHERSSFPSHCGGCLADLRLAGDPDPVMPRRRPLPYVPRDDASENRNSQESIFPSLRKREEP